MNKIRVAINGFGRIGRTTAKVLLDRSHLELVAVNDLTDSRTLAHLFKYDSIHGPFNGTVVAENGTFAINNRHIKVLAEKDPTKLPWKDLDIDVLIESTGKFADAQGAQLHLNSGAKRVVLSAPSKGENDMKTIVLGVNDHTITGEEKILSNASCTTNNVAPMIKILDDNWGIDSVFVSTVHAYTGDQNLHDAPHRDLRRARAAAMSIIPTSTGAAKAVAEVLPHLDGRIGGSGIRVPVSNGSISDITANLKKQVTVEEVNAAFKKAADTSMKNIIQYITDPIVSVDINGSPYSCIFDSELTSVIGNTVKIFGWYDNEIGYSHRLVDLVEKIFRLIPA